MSDNASGGKRPRGFAAMSPEARQAISRKGGKAAHAAGKAHEFTEDEARAAGRKGGKKTAANREHMAEIGRAGAAAREANREGGGS